MNPVLFPEANCNYAPAPDLEESQCQPVKAYRGQVQGGSVDGCQIVVTAWLPTKAELEELNQGKSLFLSFIGGLPPHFACVDFHTATHPA